MTTKKGIKIVGQHVPDDLYDDNGKPLSFSKRLEFFQQRRKNELLLKDILFMKNIIYTNPNQGIITGITA